MPDVKLKPALRYAPMTLTMLQLLVSTRTLAALAALIVVFTFAPPLTTAVRLSSATLTVLSCDKLMITNSSVLRNAAYLFPPFYA
jgi:hypothetical protein